MSPNQTHYHPKATAITHNQLTAKSIKTTSSGATVLMTRARLVSPERLAFPEPLVCARTPSLRNGCGNAGVGLGDERRTEICARECSDVPEPVGGASGSGPSARTAPALQCPVIRTHPSVPPRDSFCIKRRQSRATGEAHSEKRIKEAHARAACSVAPTQIQAQRGRVKPSHRRPGPVSGASTSAPSTQSCRR